MRKALLADDDFLVRSYLKMLPSWERAGFEIVADVRDGEEALEILKQEKIELVVTDISMPLMDGIELITEIRKNYPDIYVIVLSCHDEFEYVKKAMKEGADEYVLKNTLNEESLYTFLKTAEENIDKAQRIDSGDIQAMKENEGLQNTLPDKEKITQIIKEKFYFFNQVLAGTLNEEEKEQARINAGIRGRYQNSAVIVVQRAEKEHMEDPFEEARKEQLSLEFYQKFQDKLNQYFRDSELEEEMIYLGNGTYCCFLDLSNEYRSSVMYQYLTGSVSACSKICAEEEQKYKIGVSNICIGTDSLRQAYQQARLMIKNCFYEKDGVSYYEAGKTMGKKLPEEAEKLLEHAQILKRKNDKSTFLMMSGEAVQALKKERTESQHVCQWIRKLEHKLQLENVMSDIRFASIEDVKDELEVIADQIFEGKNQDIPEHISQPVKIAAEYAQRHYREAVGLGDAAEAAEVNSTYLSYLFSQEMGIGFAGYLLKLRIEYAKKLLRETNLKMWQVAEQSGFNDYHYFSKVFKKSEEMSPAQYRKRSEN